MRHNLLIGSLLHDIGKFICRAKQNGSVKRDYRHQELGATWAREQNLGIEIETIIKRHHNLHSDDPHHEDFSVNTFQGELGLQNDLYAVELSNNIATGTKGKRDRDNDKFDPDMLLRSIFDRINIADEKFTGSNCWQMVPLKHLPYPQEKNAAAGYHRLWQGFEEDFKNMGGQLEEEKLLTLLQNYTSTMPEHAYLSAETPDTSLYHHLKTTAAIAYCNYIYLTEEQSFNWNSQDLSKQIRNMEEHKYLLVAADLSGVQDFVYTLSSKGALKTLRARSFYLNFLQESIAAQLLDRFELPRSCVIYIGGGGFFLLAPNTGTIKRGLQRLKHEINSFLFEQFGTAIFLTLAGVTLNGRDLSGESGHLKKAWGETKKELDLQKSRKWEGLLEEYQTLFHPAEPPSYQCTSCRVAIPRPLDSLEEAQCDFCQKMARWSVDLNDIEAIYQVDSDREEEHHLKISDYHYCYQLKSGDNIKRKYLMNNYWNVEKQTPYPVLNFFQGTFYTETLFEDLVSRSLGVERIGVLRMDMDYLGKIFSRGLDSPTFTRITDLSERINLYFNCYLPALLQRELYDRLMPVEKKHLDVNLVYSGGDDLLLVGTWNGALETAYQIQRDFTLFTGGNSSLTLSGGLVVADKKMAFYKLADLAGDAEDKAKSDGRNRLCLFGKSFTWDRVKNSNGLSIHHLLSLFLDGVSWSTQRAKPELFSRSFLQKLIYFSQTFRVNEDFWVFPRLYYLFSRTMKKHNEGFYRSILAAIMQEKIFKDELIPALQIVEYLTRGGE